MFSNIVNHDRLAAQGFPCAPSRTQVAGGLDIGRRADLHPNSRQSAHGRLNDLRAEAILYSLRSARLFQGLPVEELRELAMDAVLKTIEKGSYLFREEDPAAGVYIVRRGIINAHRVSADGREQVIHLFRAGESLAEAAVVSDRSYPADARAVVRSEVIMIPRQVLLGRIRQYPELALRLIDAMNQQIEGLVSSLENLTLKDAETRLMHWLLDRCPEEETHSEVYIGMTKGVLASELGTRHETLSRILGRLRDEGHLVVKGRTITVCDTRSFRQAFEENVSRRAEV